MKIGIISVAPPFRGGISAHTSQLIQSLSTQHQITCFNFKRQYPDFLFPGKTQYFDFKDEHSKLINKLVRKLDKLFK